MKGNNAYIYCAEGNEGTTIWETEGQGISKTNSLSSIKSSKPGNLLTILNNGRGCWTKGKGYITQWRMKLTGSKIEAYTNNVLKATAQDEEFKSGSFGLFTVSQPCYFWDIEIHTVTPINLEELISGVQWEIDPINAILNFNNKKETSLTSQTCIDMFNEYNICYLGVTAPEYQDDVNTFLSKIDSRGKYIESTDYDTYMNNVIEYLISYIKKT